MLPDRGHLGQKSPPKKFYVQKLPKIVFKISDFYHPKKFFLCHAKAYTLVSVVSLKNSFGAYFGYYYIFKHNFCAD